jgi:hypothetical protein
MWWVCCADVGGWVQSDGIRGRGELKGSEELKE